MHVLDIKLSAFPLLAALLIPAMSQGPGPRGGFYNPATESTITGTVEKVVTTGRATSWQGLHLSVKAKEGIYDVHVGPAAFIAEEGFTFAIGDTIEVLGSKVTSNNAPALIAREIQKNGKSLRLRDSTGIPLWAGRGRRSQ